MNSDEPNTLPSEDPLVPIYGAGGSGSAAASSVQEQQDYGKDCQALAIAVQTLAQKAEGNVHQLLQLLRLLEKLHRQIEDGPFREALPTNRQALYALLRDIETQGGWPYIPRLRLKQIMHWIEELEELDEDPLEMD